MQITPQTKIHDLLEAYPKLENFLMALNPKYKKLKNPVLRRTVARIATLTQVAKIGGYDPIDLVNRLRREVGQPPLQSDHETPATQETQAPDWIDQTPKATVDANALLDKEKNPLAEVSKILKTLKNGDIVVIESDFLPSPLIDTFKEQGHEVFSQEDGENRFLTFVKKGH